jgi:hypothetical protein
MAINALFIVTNSFFIVILEKPTMNVLGAFVSLIGFCIAFSGYLNRKQN